MNKNITLTLSLVALIATSYASAPTKGKNIVQVAVGNGHFKILTKLVTEAGLVPALESKGPFTVIAPTDSAFDGAMKMMPSLSGYLQSHKSVLKKVLLYHVISGKVMASQLKNGMKVKTLEGESILVTIKAGHVYFNKSEVIIPNVPASNGVIHAVNTVLAPPSLVPAMKKMMMGHGMMSHPMSRAKMN